MSIYRFFTLTENLQDLFVQEPLAQISRRRNAHIVLKIQEKLWKKLR